MFNLETNSDWWTMIKTAWSIVAAKWKDFKCRGGKECICSNHLKTDRVSLDIWDDALQKV